MPETTTPRDHAQSADVDRVSAFVRDLTELSHKHKSPFENRVSGRVGVAGGCPWRRGSWPQRRRDAVRSLARAGASG